MSAQPVTSPASLVPLLRQARRRWRLRHLAVGVAITAGAVCTVLGIGALVLEAARFTPASITWARIALGIVTAIAVARWMLWPLVRRLPDDRLALYLEERVPLLGGAVLTAATLRSRDTTGHSAVLERGLVADATRRLDASPAVRSLERPATLRALACAAGAVLVFALLLHFGPPYLRLGATRLLSPSQAAALTPVYHIALTPDSLVVPRGSDVQLGAVLAGFRPELVELVIRRGADTVPERIAMGAGTAPGAHVVRLFDVTEDAEFHVEAAGVRSTMGRLIVKDLPGVERIGVELRFPGYMNLEPSVTDDGGDIAAPAGATALLKVHVTRPVSAGVLVFDAGPPVPLTRLDDSTVTAQFGVRRDGFYRVELTAPDGTVVRGTVEYIVDALEDAAPEVRIRQPGRDLRPTSVDEVFIQVEASDDYGVGRLELLYRVNGGAETVVTLTGGTGVRPRDVIAAHTLFLEEMSLAAGDVVSYYARVLDNDQRPRPKAGVSDIQFLTIRPFRRDYRQNQQGGGGEAGGPQEMNPGSLVQRQRDIVAATFRTERDRATAGASALRGDLSTLHLSQGRLRAELEALLRRVARPAAQAADSNFRVLADVLPKAGTEMKAAEELLVQGRTGDALAPEQRALQWLEKAEAAFREVQVSMQQQGGGGGGGGGNASDLADLLELQTDKMRNQYDQVQRSREEGGARQADETLERLKRLAARQQQELARQRASQGQQGSAGGASQRQLAEETEAAARQLERLAREQQSPALSQTAQEMRQAADAMRRSAASGGSGGGATQGGAAAQAAAERLESARRALESARGAAASAGIGGATDRARALAESQRAVQRDVRDMAATGTTRVEQQRTLDARKQEMEAGVTALAADLDRLARENRRANPRAARAAQDAAASIRSSRVGEKIRFSRDVLRSRGSGEYARNLERSIQQDLDSLEQRVAGAAVAAREGRDSSQRSTRALAQARDLVRGLSSLDDRVRERAGSPRAGSPGAAAPAEGTAGGGAPEGRSAQGGGAGQGAPGGGGGAGRLSDDARQLSRELAAQGAAARQLRRTLQGTGADTRELDRAITRLDALDGAQVLGDSAALAQLRGGVVENLKAFEFALRRKLGAPDAGGPALGGSGRVPARYRAMVDEYFRSLSARP
ncbi:MAG: DUF4175 family protein [Gemmatimonadaceae bacterium]|nr:DUF4175 family protein [Gemmatimonadaceae bacterium]